MCLYVKKENFEVRTAEQDLYFYKVLTPSRDGKTFYTPIYHKPVKLGETYEEEGDDFNITRAWWLSEVYDSMFDHKIDEGCFHLYETIDGAKEFAFWFCEGLRIVRAIIPKGTKYAVGFTKATVNGGLHPSIVTKKVIYKPL